MSDTNVITVHERAAETIRDMNTQAVAIGQAWRHQPEYASKAFTTLSRNLSELFSKFFGSGARITRDGDLDLFVAHETTSFVYGLIFHSKHYRVSSPVAGDIDMSYGATRTGRYCMTTVEGAEDRYCGKPFTWADGHTDDGGLRTCEGHDALPVTMPIPGDWSFHS